MLELRIDDQAFLDLIGKWLKGVSWIPVEKSSIR
jgi:hypothetical protein